MANGALSSLGIGSNGTLSYDMIDQLKEADRKAMVKPIEKDIVEVDEKQTALATLQSQVSSFKEASQALSDQTLFAQRDVSTSGDSVSASVNAGADIEDTEIHVSQLAQKGVYESNTNFANTTSLVADGATTLDLEIGSNTYNIDVDATTTLEQLRNKINDAAGEKVTASILNTGGTDPYKLIIKGDQTGVDNKITLTDSNNTLKTTFNNIQTAEDAAFTYNGVGITRSTNEVDDLINGVNLTLLKEDAAGETTNIAIEQDNSGLKTKMESFVEQYNALMGELDEMTRYDPDTGESGTFQGETTINGLKNEVSRIFTYSTSDRQSLQDYGVSLDKSGQVSFDGDKFDNAVRDKSVPEMEQFFIGNYEEIGGQERLTDGVFTRFTEMTEKYTDFSSGILRYFGEELESNEESFKEERTKAIERLDQRYETMATRFAAFDSQISDMQNSFQALQQQIDQAANSKS